ncbi:RNase H domain-containing protein [Nephila pilipes]|uniref:RNase H domain-containing protein n=1 Tax=Nephila pilipes TaxID=299642 RepID=A0A8X6QIK0_NEPPI|nr:RNase H domain-containing protein [Nephila pilipes]
MINPVKSCYTISPTHRKHKKSSILLGSVPITKVDNSKYLDVTLDAKLCFIKHLENCSNRALKKLRILNSLCGTKWVLTKLDRIQANSTQIISGAVSSTNNIKAERECELPALSQRRKYLTSKFINKIKSRDTEHISRRTFKKWNILSRLKRSSTLKYDNEIRDNLDLKHDSHNVLQESNLLSWIPEHTKIKLNLIEPCTKNESEDILKAKRIRTIETYLSADLVQIYVDGSSDETILKDGAGIHTTVLDDTTSLTSYGVRNIASNFSYQLEDKLKRISGAHNDILNQLLENDVSLDIYNKEFKACEAYIDKFISCKTKVKRIVSQSEVEVPQIGRTENYEVIQAMRLPEFSSKVFDENSREWPSFWNTFVKIHEDSK